jgi:hypothetical protein
VKEAYEIDLLSACLCVCVSSQVLSGRVNCCWSSPEQSFLFSGSVRTHDTIFVLSKTFACFEIGRTAEKTPPPAVGRVVFYAARVVSKESRRLFLPRTSCSLAIGFGHNAKEFVL